MVSWREQPTRYDIEALQDNVRRVGLVIRLRWALLVVLVTYSAFGGLAYASRLGPGELWSRMFIPGIALGFVVLYNAFYQLTYKRLGNISPLNHLQLAFDAIVVTVLVYYSGGINSWFWSMYSLFILEAAFILPRRRDAWGVMALCTLLLGMVGVLEATHVLPHIGMPFETVSQYGDPVYFAVRYGWQVAVLAGTAAVSTQLVGAMKPRSSSGQLAVLDEATGLYSRAYFLRAFAAEVSRAGRDERALHVLLIDLDHFGDFNRRFGIEVGDRLLATIAETITRVVGEAGDVLATTNLAARFGGEEFVVLFAEDAEVAGSPQLTDALGLAERLRDAITRARVEGAGVTVSIGVASFPDDGSSADDLLDAADSALAIAIEAGGDRVAQAAAVTRDESPHTPEQRHIDSLEV
ncbi:MAG: GGDEF domain-containing protein [Coriobacteriia bacterium]|nr:GGDEF domain-containing protein [Coriobacteriia bacterium]